MKTIYPKIGIRPTIDGRQGGIREGLEEKTMNLAKAVKNLIESTLKNGDGTPVEVSGAARSAGGVPDKNVMGDVAASLSFLRSQVNASGKVGVIGMCSGGRHTFLAAATLDGIDAAVDCWGGGVVCPPERLSPAQPVAPIDLADGIDCPLLGIFGNEDRSPSPEDVDTTEAVLKEKGKDYEFHRYDGAGHGIWYYDKPMYRQEQAMDSWNKVLAFFDRHLKET